jgi:hypothetical protein
MANPYTAPQTAIDQDSQPGSGPLRIKRIGVLQMAKVMAVVSFAMSLLVVPIFLLAALFGDRSGMSVVFVIFIPVFYGVFGFISGAIGAFIYNFLVKFTGGIELEFGRPQSG